METLFENKYIRDEEMAKDLYKTLHFKRPFIIFFFCVALVYTGFVIYELITVHYSEAPLLIVFIYLLIHIISSYKGNVKNTLMRDIELFGKPSEITNIVTDNFIISRQENGFPR